MVREIVAQPRFIATANLNRYRYTLSLLKEGCRVGLFDQLTLTRLQEEIMLILKDLILRYTRGDSTSVRIETAEQLLNSIYYSLDAYLRTFSNPEDGVALLRPETIRNAYQKGLALVTACVAEAAALYQALARRKLDVPLAVYRSLLEQDLPQFFLMYNVVFGAHDTPCNGDYPLVCDDMALQGVYYIKQYLENLETETRFCNLFQRDDICRVLENYGRICDSDYRESPLNLFELLLNNAIFAVLAGNRAVTLTVSLRQTEALQNRLSRLKDPEIQSTIDAAIGRLQTELGIAAPELTDYIRRYQAGFMERLCNAVANGSPSNLALADLPENRAAGGTVFAEGNRLSDAAFRLLIKQIWTCKNVSDKIAVITAGVHALTDFLDVLQADCLCGAEFAAVFGTLTDMELAVLCCVGFGTTFRNNPRDLMETLLTDLKAETQWQRQFGRFIAELDEARRQSIGKHITELQPDEIRRFL